MSIDYVMAPSVTLDAGRRAIAAAIIKAEELAVDVCIAVTDGGGHLLAMVRMDRAPLLCIQIARLGVPVEAQLSFEPLQLRPRHDGTRPLSVSACEESCVGATVAHRHERLCAPDDPEQAAVDCRRRCEHAPRQPPG